MKRITVAMAREAYAQTGLRPMRGVTIGRKYACPIGAITKAKGLGKVGALPQTCGLALGLTREYTSDFATGFDGYTTDLYYTLGYDDSVACAKALFAPDVAS